MAADSWGLHWFRRDLRIAGNQALRENWSRHKGRVLGLFCFDSKFLSRDDFSSNRFAFFLETLANLQAEFRQAGGELLVVDCLAKEAFGLMLTHCKKHRRVPSLVTWCRDYEPFARERDSQIESLLKNLDIPFQTFRDHLILEPHEVLKSEKPGDFYQVFSPFGKKWFHLLPKNIERIESQASIKNYLSPKTEKKLFCFSWKDLDLPPSPFSQDALQDFKKKNAKNVTVPIPPAGFSAAHQALMTFKEKVKDYQDRRDFPAIPGTSRLSIYLKNGSLTTSQILYELGSSPLDWNLKTGKTQFIKEIVWREFYYSILYHQPDVEKESFLPQYRDLAWENEEKFFLRWKEGTTGFPIVDAGMRELTTTGWMHNRVRMIVASFLTKDLLIDWRWGENHFMKYLLDGDLAPNNGGWQWAASTGCDPQPYFRIFNPWLQSKKFDPDGDYIKKFVPELQSAPAKTLHDPEASRRQWKYPDPIVDHNHQRMKALTLYKLKSS